MQGECPNLGDGIGVGPPSVLAGRQCGEHRRRWNVGVDFKGVRLRCGVARNICCCHLERLDAVRAQGVEYFAFQHHRPCAAGRHERLKLTDNRSSGTGFDLDGHCGTRFGQAGHFDARCFFGAVDGVVASNRVHAHTGARGIDHHLERGARPADVASQVNRLRCQCMGPLIQGAACDGPATGCVCHTRADQIETSKELDGAARFGSARYGKGVVVRDAVARIAAGVCGETTQTRRKRRGGVDLDGQCGAIGAHIACKVSQLRPHRVRACGQSGALYCGFVAGDHRGGQGDRAQAGCASKHFQKITRLGIFAGQVHYKSGRGDACHSIVGQSPQIVCGQQNRRHCASRDMVDGERQFRRCRALGAAVAGLDRASNDRVGPCNQIAAHRHRDGLCRRGHKPIGQGVGAEHLLAPAAQPDDLDLIPGGQRYTCEGNP